MLDCGIRVSKLVSIDVEDIQLAEGYVKVSAVEQASLVFLVWQRCRRTAGGAYGAQSIVGSYMSGSVATFLSGCYNRLQMDFSDTAIILVVP
jgi:hypothetical protein